MKRFSGPMRIYHKVLLRCFFRKRYPKPLLSFIMKAAPGLIDLSTAILRATDARLTADGRQPPFLNNKKMQTDYNYNLGQFQSWLMNVRTDLQAYGYDFKPQPDILQFGAAHLNDELGHIRFLIGEAQ